MSVLPVKQGDTYTATGDGLEHYEGQAETRAEVMAFSTNYRVGSEIFCTEDFSLWLLSEVEGTKAWKEVVV